MNISVLDQHEVVYIARSNSPRVVSIGFHAGARVPAHTVTPGVLLLGDLSDAALERWLANHEFSGFTPYTLDANSFRESVRDARAQGSGSLIRCLTWVWVVSGSRSKTGAAKPWRP